MYSSHAAFELRVTMPGTVARSYVSLSAASSTRLPHSEIRQFSGIGMMPATVTLPAGTRHVEMVLMGTRNAGSDNDSYFDDLFLELGACQ